MFDRVYFRYVLKSKLFPKWGLNCTLDLCWEMKGHFTSSLVSNSLKPLLLSLTYLRFMHICTFSSHYCVWLGTLKVCSNSCASRYNGLKLFLENHFSNILTTIRILLQNLFKPIASWLLNANIPHFVQFLTAHCK